MRRLAVAGTLALSLATHAMAAGPDLLDAAFSLSEFGVASGDADLVASAAEAILATAGDDREARDLALEWLGEARFLARGDAGILSRISAIEAIPPGPGASGLAAVRTPGGATVEIRPGAAETELVLRAAGPLAAAPDQAGRALDCTPVRTGGLRCALAPGAGPVTVAGAAPGSPPALVFYRPAGPDGGRVP